MGHARAPLCILRGCELGSLYKRAVAEIMADIARRFSHRCGVRVPADNRGACSGARRGKRPWGAYRCNVRLSGLLFAHGLSPHHTEKILIQIDSAAHGIAYAPDKKILNKFDVFTEIFVTPVDILLSQKINAALNRKRAKGRDFYDIVFLLASTTPNYRYLQQKLKIENADALRKRLLSATVRFDFTALARDVQPFLFHLQDARKVELFRQFIAQASLA